MSRLLLYTHTQKCRYGKKLVNWIATIDQRWGGCDGILVHNVSINHQRRVHYHDNGAFISISLSLC